jgi:hypothetical protein
MRLALAGAALAVIASPFAAGAQESTNRVAANTDWSVFVEDNPKQCWVVSAPKESVATKDGKPVAVRRGDILLFVTYAPGGSQGEVSFSGGYAFADGSSPTLDVAGQTFKLFLSASTDPEMAWSASSEDDAKIVAAMKSGSSAVVTATSKRGTQTKDTFSLNGVSAALDEAAKRCAG